MTMYVRFPLSLRNVEDLLLERGPPLPRDGAAVVESLRRDVAADIRRQRVSRMRGFPALEWHLDEM